MHRDMLYNNFEDDILNNIENDELYSILLIVFKRIKNNKYALGERNVSIFIDYHNPYIDNSYTKLAKKYNRSSESIRRIILKTYRQLLFEINRKGHTDIVNMYKIAGRKYMKMKIKELFETKYEYLYNLSE